MLLCGFTDVLPFPDPRKLKLYVRIVEFLNLAAGERSSIKDVKFFCRLGSEDLSEGGTVFSLLLLLLLLMSEGGTVFSLLDSNKG